MEHPDFPDGIQIIGWDDAVGHYAAHYFDSRGLARRYEMSMDDGVWTMWRDEPGFSQRFTGTFGDGGRTITGRWERSSDGSTWEHDFDLTYRKTTQSTSAVTTGYSGAPDGRRRGFTGWQPLRSVRTRACGRAPDHRRLALARHEPRDLGRHQADQIVLQNRRRRALLSATGLRTARRRAGLANPWGLPAERPTGLATRP